MLTGQDGKARHAFAPHTLIGAPPQITTLAQAIHSRYIYHIISVHWHHPKPGCVFEIYQSIKHPQTFENAVAKEEEKPHSHSVQQTSNPRAPFFPTSGNPRPPPSRMFSIMPLPVYKDYSPTHHHHRHHATAEPSPLSSSPIRASSPPQPLSPRDHNERRGDRRQIQSSPIKPSSSSASASRFASRPSRPNPVVRGREGFQEARRNLFLKKVQQRSDDRRWERRGVENKVCPSQAVISEVSVLSPFSWLIALLLRHNKKKKNSSRAPSGSRWTAHAARPRCSTGTA